MSTSMDEARQQVLEERQAREGDEPMSAHTKGPWADDFYTILGDSGEIVCHTSTETSPPLDECRANTARIVECVNAMEPGGKVDALVEAARAMRDPCDHDDWPCKCHRDLRAALAPFALDPQGATPRAEGLETPTEGSTSEVGS